MFSVCLSVHGGEGPPGQIHGKILNQVPGPVHGVEGGRRGGYPSPVTGPVPSPVPALFWEGEYLLFCTNSCPGEDMRGTSRQDKR